MASLNPQERRAIIIGDTATGRDTARQTAQALDIRILFEGDLHQGADRVREGFAGDVVLVDLAGADEAPLTRVLASLAGLAATQHMPIIVNSAIECLDEAVLWLDAPNTIVMSNAQTVDWVSALAIAHVQKIPAFHEAATENTLRLQRLADEVDRIARTLSDIAGSTGMPLRGVSDATFGFGAGRTLPAQAPVSEADVRTTIKLRRMRDRFFPADLFADPAWDMLLDLMAARLGNYRVAVSSLCIASAVPPTTALRWIKTMTDAGLFARRADDEDGRRVFIELSDSAAQAMMHYLVAAKAEGGLAI